MGGELVGLVKNRQIPPRSAELLLQVFVPRKLIEANNQLIVAVERISARRGLLQHWRVDVKLQPELLEQLVPPLLNQAARRDHENAAGIRAHYQLPNVKPSHDRLAGAGVIGK